MPLPSPNVTAAQLWAELVKVPVPFRDVDFPRFKPGTEEPICKVRLKSLTQAEIMAANVDTERKVRRLLKDGDATVPKSDEIAKGYHELFANCAAVEILFRSCKDPSDEQVLRPFFQSKEDIQAHLLPREIGTLMLQYQHMEAEIGPAIDRMRSEEEMEAWTMQVVRGGSQDPFFLVSQLTLIDLATFLAWRLYGSPAAKSSPGEALGSGETSSKIEAPPERASTDSVAGS